MIVEQREVRPPEENEVVIKVEAVGICGSEIEGYLGHNSLRRPPLVMGHEFSGHISETGRSVTGLSAGDKVVVNPLIYCSHCDRCRKGKINLCDSRKIVGIHMPGGFAEYVTVPASTVRLVPESVSPFRAALTEPLACSLRATRRAMADAVYANVAVIGAGAIGLLCAFVAQLMGARKVIVIDTNGERLKTAESVGIGYTANPAEHNLKTRIAAITDSRGVDVVIDAAGFQPTRNAAMEMVNPGGTIMNIGLGIDETQVRINHAIRNEINILGSFCYSQQDFSDALNLLADGRITEAGWTTVRSLEEGGRAFADLVAGKVAQGKIFLEVK